MKDCVISGMGMVSCLGLTLGQHFRALCNGHSGIARIKAFDPSGFKPIAVGEVSNQALADYKKQLLIPCTMINNRKEILSAVAASEAWRDAFLNDPGMKLPYAPNRISVVWGTGLNFGAERIIWEGENLKFENLYPVLDSNSFLDQVESDNSIGLITHFTKARGLQLQLNSACAASAHALGIGLELIRTGSADVVVAGGVDSMINPVGIAGFQLLGVTSLKTGDPQKACRPFDRRRSGTVIGEGSTVFILESFEGAQNRGHKFWGYLEGSGYSVDGHSVTAPEPEGTGITLAMEQALKAANKMPLDIEYINAHGTGTFLNDIAETKSIKNVFGDNARNIPISSTKPITGHLVAAAGAIEAAITILSLNSGILFPTINLDNPDPCCDLDYIPISSRKKNIEVALSNCFGLGGQNSCLVLSSPPEKRL